MASHRKLMSADDDTSTEDYCNGTCTAACLSFKQTCLTYCYDNCDNFSSLYPPPPPPNSSHTPLKTSKLLIIIFTIVATTFIALCCYVIYRKYKSRRIAESQTVVEQRLRDDFIDEDHGPIIDHPIWYIRTVGLNQAVIDSISVIKYKEGEGLIEGTDCSVCLSEFQEDDTLRLLPKCSHAFHIPCIDTWLRSHTNCPLCRAPIVSNTVVASLPERNIEESQSIEVRVDVLEETEEESEGGIGRIEEEGEGSDSAQFQVNRDIGYPKEGETLSNLVSNRSRFQINHDSEDTEQGIQPIRRSVSLDSLAASKITQEIGDLEKESKVVIVPRRVGGSRRFLKLMMGSSSVGRSLQSGPVLMKRSSSCQGKLGRNAELPVRSF